MAEKRSVWSGRELSVCVRSSGCFMSFTIEKRSEGFKKQYTAVVGLQSRQHSTADSSSSAGLPEAADKGHAESEAENPTSQRPKRRSWDVRRSKVEVRRSESEDEVTVTLC